MTTQSRFLNASVLKSVWNMRTRSPRTEQQMQPAGGRNNHFTEMCSGTEAGSYLRLIDSCITQLEAQGPSRTCNESKEGEKKQRVGTR